MVAGHLEFYKTVHEKGLKPLLGIETYQARVSRYENYGGLRDKETKEKLDNFHLILVAMNNEGLHNLWALNTESHATGYYYTGRVDWELLAKYNQGIIATSACGLGMLQQSVSGNSNLESPETVLARYLEIFGNRFYLEIGTYPKEFQYEMNIGTVSLAKDFGVPVVYGNDAHYAYPEQYDLHEQIIALKDNNKMSDPVRGEQEDGKGRLHHEPALYIMSEGDIREHLSYLPNSVVDEALKNSDKIADKCDVSLPEFTQHVPMYIPDTSWKSSKEMLLGLVEEAFEEKIAKRGLDQDFYFDRLSKELKVIYDAHLVDYLLMVRDYCNFADEQGIMRGPGRGSAGGSLVVYLLGITDVDPIRYGLIFERFYNAGRETSLPDIDIDFATTGREQIKEYVTERYGKDYVSDIGNVVRLQPKSAFNDIARVNSIDFKDSKAISAILEKSIKQGLQSDWDTIWEELGPELTPYQEKYPKLFEDATSLLETYPDSKDEQVRQYSVHATGVLVSDVPLAGNFPLRMTTSNKEKKIVSQWDMRDAEKLGYMKIDLCGLRNLDTLTQLNQILVESGREPIDFKALQDEALPEEMWELLDKGATIGIFQVENEPLAKEIAKRVHARSIEDLGPVVALNRPGALYAKDASGTSAKDRFLLGAQGHEVAYVNDIMKSVTENTYGIFLYQEQIINFMIAIGYTLMQADDVRSIMGKKKKDLIDKEYERYIPLACKHMPKSEADELWKQIKEFAKYGFNKSHAIEYGLILLWTLYGKWYAPKEFLTASIRTVDKEKKALYVNEAKKLKIPVYAPEFGKAKAFCSLFEDGIMLGYGDIQGIGYNPAKWLEDHTTVGMTEEELIQAIIDNPHIQANGKKAKAIKADVISALGQLGLFDTGIELTKEERLAIEEELLKVAISDNSAIILEEYSDEINEYCTPYALVDEAGEYSVAGIIRDIKQGKTKYDQIYAKVKIADDSDEMEFFVWSKELKKLSFIFRNRTAGIFNLKKNDKSCSLVDAVILYPKHDSPYNYDRI